MNKNKNKKEEKRNINEEKGEGTRGEVKNRTENEKEDCQKTYMLLSQHAFAKSNFREVTQLSLTST